MFEKVKQFLVEECRVNPDTITLEAELAGDLGINSLELAELVFVIEDRLNIEIDDEDILGIRTVGDLVAYLEDKAQ